MFKTSTTYRLRVRPPVLQKRPAVVVSHKPTGAPKIVVKPAVEMRPAA